MVTNKRKKKLKTVLENRQPDFSLVFEDVWDPHNVAAVLRTADAFGVLKCHLVYEKAKFPNLKRVGKASSSSANKWIDLERHENIEKCVETLHKRGFKVYSTVISGKAVPLHEIDLTEKVAVMFGNEHSGLSDKAIELSDKQITIPMIGMVQSLNISVSAAIVLWEMYRQREQKNMYPHKWNKAEFNQVLSEWKEK